MSLFAVQQNNDPNHSSNFSPSSIINAANAKVPEDIPGAEMIFQGALLEWVDIARESGQEGSDAYQIMKDAIVDLWIGYADFYRNLKKFKSALDTYENATQCPVSKSSGKIWRNYTAFCRSRNRPRHAQTVFLRALTGENRGAVTNEIERFKLWNDFLEMSRETSKNPNLTLDQLMNAVENEIPSSNTSTTKSSPTVSAIPIPVGSMPPSVSQMEISTGDSNENLRPNKVQKTFHHDPSSSVLSSTISPHLSTFPTTMTNEQQNSMIMTESQIQSALSLVNPAPSISATLSLSERIQKETENLLSKIGGNSDNSSKDTSVTFPTFLSTSPFMIPPEIMAEWLAMDGDSSPTRPEPPLFDPSPPKLDDSSGKNLLGSEMALQIIRQCKHPEKGTLLLDICRACWMMTALKEQEVQKAMVEFEKNMREDLEALENKLSARLVVTDPVHADAIQQTNQIERDDVQKQWKDRQKKFVGSIAWEFRKLLHVQQLILGSCNLPHFTPQSHVPGHTGIANGSILLSVDPIVIKKQSRVCKILHSAFYVRAKVGKEPHCEMLAKKEATLMTEIPTPPPTVTLSSSSTRHHQKSQRQKRQQPQSSSTSRRNNGNYNNNRYNTQQPLSYEQYYTQHGRNR